MTDTNVLGNIDTSYATEFVGIRHDLHRHPELSFQERRTSDLVAGYLESWGYEVERGLGGTGLVGQLRRGGGKRRLGLRADMDALPITEQTGLEYASTNAGVMHACGHDGHTTMLLCAAKALAEEGGFSGTLNLIFQPAEEYGTSECGAVAMMQDGLFDKYPCDAIFGMHNMPGWLQGQLLFRDGAMMASSDKVCITIHGHSGHGAMPHLTCDPIVAASSLVMALQSVVSRNVDPLQSAIVTVGVLQAGKANNVIPQTAYLELTVRTFDAGVRDLIRERITQLSHAHAKSFNATAEIDYQTGYTVLVNSREETAFARKVAVELVGDDRVIRECPPLTGSEDFAFMLEQCPGCYLLIGNGDSESDGPGACSVHNAAYDFNDRNIATGGAYWALLAQRFLT